MGLTLTQCVARAGDLSGELKAARELRAVCAADCDARDFALHEAVLARHALANADANIARLETERADVAQQAYLHILAKGDPPPLADEQGPAIAHDLDHHVGRRLVPDFDPHRKVDATFDRATQDEACDAQRGRVAF